jgi:hypothetical protein
VARIELLCETAIGALGDNGCEWESLPRPPYPRLPLAHRLGAGLLTINPSSLILIETLGETYPDPNTSKMTETAPVTTNRTALIVLEKN